MDRFGANLWFSVFPASISETLGAAFLIAIFGLILGWAGLKQNLKSYWMAILFIPGSMFISGLYGFLNHLARYGGSEVAISSVVLFWVVLGFLISATGSIIPGIIFHDLNNFFVSFGKFFGSEVVAFTTLTVVGILVAVFLLVWRKVRKSKAPEVPT